MYLFSKIIPQGKILSSTPRSILNSHRALFASAAASKVDHKKLVHKDGKVLVPVSFRLPDGSLKNEVFQVDTGCKYTQLNTETAALMNLLSSFRLLAKTVQPDPVFHYLCGTTLIVDEKEVPLVVRVGPDQPNVLGLNALLPLKAIFDLGKKTLQVEEIDEDEPNPYLDWNKLVLERSFTEANLRPVHWLMPPAVAVANYGGKYLIDLETQKYESTETIPSKFGLDILDVTDPNVEEVEEW